VFMGMKQCFSHTAAPSQVERNTAIPNTPGRGPRGRAQGRSILAPWPRSPPCHFRGSAHEGCIDYAFGAGFPPAPPNCRIPTETAQTHIQIPLAMVY
jgi:hypothetical protein